MTQQQIAYQSMLNERKKAEASMLQAQTSARNVEHNITTAFSTDVVTGAVSTLGGLLTLAFL